MTIDDIQELYYHQQLSAKEVGKRLQKTVWQVFKFMKKHNLTRRSSKETYSYTYARLPLTYTKKVNLTPNDEKLLISGLMLYWAEGAKNTGAVVDLANSDPKMLAVFIKVLREIYRVKEQKFRILLYCYKNQNEEKLKKFWSQLLKIPQDQFLKSYIREDFDPTKTNKMPFGVTHLRYYDKKLYSQIKKDLDIIAENFLK